jgi:hypothetical protein
MSSTKLRILSLGAGVQSTTLALMAAHGDIGPMPDAAIFADTGDEPGPVYDHLRWLMSPNVLPFPVHITTAGHLSEKLLEGDDEARIPFHVGAGGLSKRQCTRNYKLKPIRRKVRELLGVGPRGYIAPGSVEMWVGISTDEAIRMKPSGCNFVVNRWPLLEARMSRGDCIEWMRRHGYPTPPKSSCVFCPYRRNDQWRDLRDNDPAGWAHAVRVDAKLREPDQITRFRGELYAHRSCVPLDQVDLSTAEDRGQLNLFLNECEGMCGV